jgi:hypothetical protein
MQYFFTDKFIGIDREKLQKKVGDKKLVFMKQIHSDIVAIVDRNSPVMECDAMITNDKGVALCVVVADCIPVILKDNVKKVVAVAHAGRVGSYKDIIKKTIEKMKKEFTCKEDDIHINFGPSIKKCCYEVGSEVIDGYEDFTCIKNGKIYLDLIELNKHGLKNLEIDPTCTSCDTNYFSYRRDATKKRFCGVVSLD